MTALDVLRDVRAGIPPDQHVALAAIGEAMTRLELMEDLAVDARPHPPVSAVGLAELARGRNIDGAVHRFGRSIPDGHPECSGCGQLWPCQPILAYADALARRVPTPRDDAAAAIAAWEEPEIEDLDPAPAGWLLPDRVLVVLTAVVLGLLVDPTKLVEYLFGILVGGLVVWIFLGATAPRPR